ncbi:hypothetical protein PVAND_014817 [Polypedilum vanderplanki]|uniref:Arrestin C-terminal-like domain-containing protein n=1 Tax=Polypedilum vanderplanki TaxID=319348 RepID=A0A9J6BAV0_POLVA|nr:hypothetical protein PVAND_014817 [Polypedilum vanderplanki]
MNCEVKFLRNTNAVYYSGNLLEATVEMNLTECVRINEITSKFIGYAKTEWTVDISKYNLQTFTGRIDYLDKKIQVLNEDSTAVDLSPGTHNFDFQFQLPENIPTSYKSKFGSIKYKIQVVINFSSLTKSELFFDLPFIVIHPINLNSIYPSLNEPIKVELAKKFNFNLASSDLNMMVVVPQGGYVAGQAIEVLVQIENLGRTRVKYVKIALRKISKYSCQLPKPLNKTSTEVLIKEVIYNEIPSKSKRDFLRSIFIPPVPPNIENCDLINVSYELKVKAKTIGWNKSPALKIPIKIGTVAIANDNLIYGEGMSNKRVLPPAYEDSFRNSAITDTSSDEEE